MAERPQEVVVTPATLREWPLPLLGDSKDERGRALVVGGSVPNPGGAMLSAEASLRAGAGKVQLVTAEPVAPLVAVQLPEAMVRGAAVTSDGDLDERAAAVALELADDAKALLVGPGVLDVDDAVALMGALVPSLEVPVLVIDALALAWVTQEPSRLKDYPGQPVLSPNVKELALTLGIDEDACDQDVPGRCAELARLTGAVVTSGRETTWVAEPSGEQVWRIDVGGPGLAVAGSGDVKAGVILGLCARGVEPVQAVVWGSYLHGATGDRLSSRVGPTGFLARELSAQIPALLTELEH